MIDDQLLWVVGVIVFVIIVLGFIMWAGINVVDNGNKPTHNSCLKISGQTCELALSCPIGKTSGSGTCETGKVCCKPEESKITIIGEANEIVI